MKKKSHLLVRDYSLNPSWQLGGGYCDLAPAFDRARVIG
jgi:hypothetical protein